MRSGRDRPRTSSISCAILGLNRHERNLEQTSVACRRDVDSRNAAGTVQSLEDRLVRDFVMESLFQGSDIVLEHPEASQDIEQENGEIKIDDLNHVIIRRVLIPRPDTRVPRRVRPGFVLVNLVV